MGSLILNRRNLVLGAVGSVAAIAIPRSSLSSQAPVVPADAQEATVIDHPDGEKMKVQIDGEEREVRMIGIDSPEIKNADNLPECFAAESQEYLRQLVPAGSTVLLEGDQEDKDSKDRLWRYVWFRHPSIGEQPILVNERVVRDGFAIDREEEKNTRYEVRIAEAQAAAQAEAAGLWGTCGGGHVAITPIPRHGSADDPGVLGERLEASGMAVTLQSAYTTYSYGMSTPRGGYKFLVAELFLENISNEEKGYSDTRIKVKNLENDAWYKDLYRPSDQPLDSGALSPGSYIYGVVGVEIQEIAVNLRFEYKINAVGGDIVYWNIIV